jgi:superfamily I DNA/RNA helicase
VETITRFITTGEEQRTCLVARTNEMVNQYVAALEAQGIRVCRLRRGTAEDHSKLGLRVGTMHRVKGLEFDRMIVAGINEGVVPLAAAYGDTEDRAVKSDVERQERALLYVSISRARRAVLATSSGTPSPWLAAPNRLKSSS